MLLPYYSPLSLIDGINAAPQVIWYLTNEKMSYQVSKAMSNSHCMTGYVGP